ncbi:MAG TPA: DUF1566 domain-containing protein [Anaerolineae bacterium]|nr:DUF1566 domain-containing protein [Anaerolineae bacterium]
MRSKTLLICVIGIVIGVLLSAAVVFAGSLDLAAGPADPNSQMYTLEQIYQRLTTGNYFAKQSGFTEPDTGPAATMVTLDDIMVQAQPRALAPRVPKTGQTQCWDPAGTLIDCVGTGQDGAYQAGIDPAVAPTSGTTGAYNTPAWTGVRFTDNGDGTVTDNLTALIWLQNANCFVSEIWPNGLTLANTLASGSCGLSDGSSAGQWRMPNANEMHSLIDLTQTFPAFLPGHPFINVAAGQFYWTSSAVPSSPVAILPTPTTV